MTSLILLISALMLGLPGDSSACRMLGRWPFGGGEMPEDLVNDTIAYVNAGGGMFILNVKDPTNITKVGELQTPGMPWHFSVHDTFLCVGEYRAGVALYSIADLSQPRLLGRCVTPDLAIGTAFDGRYAYVACYDSGVRVVDFKDPAHPGEVARLLVPDGASGLEAQGQYLFIDAMRGGIRIADISDPLSPFEVGAYDNGSWAQSFRVRDSLLYVAFAESGLVVVNVADPTNPVELSAFNGGWQFRDLAVSGSFAYATINNPVQIKVIDIRDPEHPALTSTYRPPEGLSFYGIAVRGKRCYTVYEPDKPQGGLWVIDVSDSAHPSLAGSFSLPQEINVIANAETLAFAGLDGGGMQVFSIAEPSHIYLLGETDDTSRVGGLCVDLPYVYAALYNGAYFEVIDVSNPRHPTIVGLMDSLGFGHDVVVESEFAYVSDGHYLRVIDVSTPAHPTQVARLSLPSTAFGLAISGNYCYVGDWYGGIQIVDISSPANPQIVGSYPTPFAAAEDIVVQGQYAFFTDGFGFGILDVSDPTSPKSVFYDTIPNQVWGIDATSKLLCVALLDSGIELLDYPSDPAHPVVVGNYRTPFWAHNVSIVDRDVYVADRAGFCVLQYGALGVEERKASGLAESDARVLGTVTRNAITLNLNPSTPSQVAILDVTGRTRFTTNYGPREVGQNRVRLDVSGLPAGVYFVEVRGQSQRRLLKVLLAR